MNDLNKQKLDTEQEYSRKLQSVVEESNKRITKVENECRALNEKHVSIRICSPISGLFYKLAAHFCRKVQYMKLRQSSTP